MDIIICVIVTLLNGNWNFFISRYGWPVVVLRGELYIGVINGCWLLVGGCFWEVYNVLVLC